MSKLPTQTKLQQAWEELKEIHKEYLERHEVVIPTGRTYDSSAKSIWLSVLFYYKGQPVHKDVISDVCQRDKANLARDQQIRHLKRGGWSMKNDGRGNHELNPYEPSLEFLNEKVRRDGRLHARTFDDVKKAFGYRCATCGAKEERPDSRYGRDKVILQQGHKDPEKPSSDKNNIIPQCQFCNRAYRGDFTFDDKGRARAVADVGPVERVSDRVKSKIFNWLKDFFQ